MRCLVCLSRGVTGALERSCATSASLYQKYANLCIKDAALAHGRITFEQGQVRPRDSSAIVTVGHTTSGRYYECWWLARPTQDYFKSSVVTVTEYSGHARPFLVGPSSALNTSLECIGRPRAHS